MKKTAFGLIFTLVFLSGSLLAKSYKWVDEEGNITYSQTPPPDNRASTEIEPPPPAAESPEKARKRLDTQLQQSDTARAQKKTTSEEAATSRQDAAQNRQNCENARTNLDTLQNTPANRRFKMESGEFRKYTEEEKDEKVREAKEQIETHCK